MAQQPQQTYQDRRPYYVLLSREDWEILLYRALAFRPNGLEVIPRHDKIFVYNEKPVFQHILVTDGARPEGLFSEDVTSS